MRLTGLGRGFALPIPIQFLCVQNYEILGTGNRTQETEVKRYLPLIWTISLLLLCGGCDLVSESFDPKQVSGNPSTSESSLHLHGKNVSVTADILSVDVTCSPVKKENTSLSILGDDTEYEIVAVAHIGYQIDGATKANALSNLEANLLFEPVTASGCRRALVPTKVRFTKNAQRITAMAKISGLSAKEMSKISEVQVRWEG